VSAKKGEWVAARVAGGRERRPRSGAGAVAAEEMKWVSSLTSCLGRAGFIYGPVIYYSHQGGTGAV